MTEMDLMIIFIITCILFLCSVIALIQIRSCSPTQPTHQEHDHTHRHDRISFILALVIMILSGLLVITVGYMILNPEGTPSQFLGADTCDEPTCSDGPTVGSENMYGVSAFDDSEYDI
jgi:heme/copper-type cytochrome/quinol oxidase subunit 2